MKKCYFLFSLLLCFVANAQIVNIPDANFKAKLLSASSNNQVASSSLVFVNSEWSPPDYCKIDINNDGEIQVSEALNIKFLQLQGVDITDLTGLEAFINLEYFSHGSSYLNPSLNSINVSQNTLLKVLRIGNNNFSSLDVSNNINLLELYCNSNNLASLDISNNPLLKKLYCYNNNISILDFSNNPNLSYLQCGENSLTSIDVSICPLLTFLSCYFNNDLLSINVKNNNPGLILSFSGTPNLQYICADEGDIAMIQQKINDYGYTTCHVNSYCTFTPGGTFYDVQGNIYLDIDNNGCDTTDPTLPNMRATIVSGTSNSTLITSNQLSSYYIPVGAGNHTITYDFLNSNYFTISPSSITVDFPTQASPFMQDICVTPNGQHSDVEVTILPLNAARPGFDANYKIVYKNIGNQAETGNVTLTFQDDVLDYVTSTPVYNATGSNTLTWDFTNLLPFETREILVIFNVNGPTETPPVNNGDILNYTATIAINNTDEDLSNNVADLVQIVVGSYDPNDKTCLEGETVAPNMVGEYVHYMIRFENTGTYPAENIVVKDMIDTTKFDIATLVPISGSHEFYTRINGNKVEFIFENINLPFNDANNDGYVVFKIKTLPSLVIGDTFSNQANIYFDYNFPITTNNFTTTVQQPLSIQDFAFDKEFTIYPNPVKNELHISNKNKMEIQSLEIYNVLGQLVMAVTHPNEAIEVSQLKTGNYFVKVTTEKGSSTTKFIKD